MKLLNSSLSITAFSIASTICLAQPSQTAKPVTAVTTPLTKQQQLTHAIVQDEIDVVRTLLTQGVKASGRSDCAAEDKWMLNSRPNNDPAQPLIVLACHFMSIKGDDIIRMLLDKGADVNIADKNGITPLMAASELGGSVSLVLEHKPNVNAADKDGRTALMYAMNNLGINTASHLLEHGARINAQDSRGQTALMLALTEAQHDRFIIYGEDQKKKAENETKEYHELIKFLVDSHADVRLKDKAGNTALSIAKTVNDPEVIKMLKDAGAKD